MRLKLVGYVARLHLKKLKPPLTEPLVVVAATVAGAAWTGQNRSRFGSLSDSAKDSRWNWVPVAEPGSCTYVVVCDAGQS